MSDILQKCDVCEKAAKHKCSGCHNAYYCSKEHQQTGWQIHKKHCRPFKILDDESIGRYLIATKDIKEGDVILQEQPLIQGPMQLTPPVCLGCENFIDAEHFVSCSKCGWPMCNQMCEKSLKHTPECYFTAKRGQKVTITNFNIPHPIYACVTVLRCLYQKKFNPDVWKTLLKFESHCEERMQNEEKYEYEKTYIVNFIRTFFHLEDEFSVEEILKICGIVTINGHEVPLSLPPHVSIFQLTSMLEHSCRANCYKTFSSEGDVIIIAGRTIETGDHLSICYTDPLWTTPNRQKHLLETKFFCCTCERCSDATEFGSNLSAIKCRKENCGKGILLPKSFLTQNENWICKQCETELSPKCVETILERIGQDLQAMEKGNASACKMFLEYYGKLLPQNHFYIIDVKSALSQIIGQEFKNNLQRVEDNDLNLKIKLCREINELVEIVAPAEKRLKGALLFDLYLAITEMNRRKGNLTDCGDLVSALMECKKILIQVLENLKHQPEVLPEGKLYHEAKKHLEKLDVLLSGLVHNMDDL